ncbi:hypothetical protein SUGI_0337600 [Cryptomeria japonica]|nr:hypothetical protein SUGI_0337600 [Cryptomeria japonica]
MRSLPVSTIATIFCGGVPTPIDTRNAPTLFPRFTGPVMSMSAGYPFTDVPISLSLALLLWTAALRRWEEVILLPCTRGFVSARKAFACQSITVIITNNDNATLFLNTIAEPYS